VQPFTKLTGAAVPLMLDNVDTDVIIRIDRLGLRRDELGPYALEALRVLPDGTPNPGCPLNRAAFRGAPIMLAGNNFGCGSSREGAVWALACLGVRCIVAPSFGDIFMANCFQNGMLPVVLPAAAVQELARQTAAGSAASIDLERCEVLFPDGRAYGFTVDPLKRDALLQGLDEVTQTLMERDAIAAWQAQDRLARPWVWSPVARES
jgi:3-isopropylmalate/(R)-2-methylmalate dehydratase small subunit